MLRFVIAPDSYKGSLSATQVGLTVALAIKDELPDAEVITVPMADGGEGTIDALIMATSGQKVSLEVTGPLGDRVSTYHGILGTTKDTAVLEIANIAGLPMLPTEGRDPLNVTSTGLGESIRAVLDEGFRKLVIGLGGSATNDGGMGCLQALGVVFSDSEGNALQGYGRDLAKVHTVDYSGLDPRIADCEIVIASDVRNPLCGPEGATIVFGPQKGATFEQVKSIEQAMTKYAGIVEEHLQQSFQQMPGAGAAGGIGFALLTLGSKIVPGAQVVEQMAGLSGKLKQADWVITGEGRSDEQTLYGKLPMHVGQIAKQNGVPAILISGSLGDGQERLRDYFAGCFSIVSSPITLEECMMQADKLLYECTRNVVRLLSTVRRDL